jgi:hypothetical protein
MRFSLRRGDMIFAQIEKTEGAFPLKNEATYQGFARSNNLRHFASLTSRKGYVTDIGAVCRTRRCRPWRLDCLP